MSAYPQTYGSCPQCRRYREEIERLRWLETMAISRIEQLEGYEKKWLGHLRHKAERQASRHVPPKVG